MHELFLSATIDEVIPLISALSHGDKLNLTESFGISSIQFESDPGFGIFARIFAPNLPSLAFVILQETVIVPFPGVTPGPVFKTAVNGLIHLEFTGSGGELKVKLIVLVA